MSRSTWPAGPTEAGSRPAIAQRGGPRSTRRFSRLLILGGLVLALAVTAEAALTAWAGYRRALAESGRELRNLAAVLADHTDRAVQGVEIQQATLIDRMRAEGVASPDDLRIWARGRRVHDMLRDRIAGMPQVVAVTIVDAEGRLLNFSRPGPVPALVLSDRDYFQALRDGASRFISRPVRSRATDARTIYIARRVSGPTGEFLGMILGAVELAYFERVFGSLALGPGSHVSLLRADGILLAHYPSAEPLIGRDFGHTPQFHRALAHTDGPAFRTPSAIGGEERLIAGRALTAYPLRIHVGTTVSAVLADWRRQTASLAAGTALLLALIAAAVSGAIYRRRAEAAADEERLRRERDLVAQHAKFRAAVEGMSQGLWMFDAAGRLELTNGRGFEIIGYPPEALQTGATFAELRASAGMAAGAILDRLAEFVEARRAGSFVHETEAERSISVTHQPLEDGGCLATFEDLTEHRAVAARVEHMVRHDALTGLPNRVLLMERLDEILAGARQDSAQTAVLCIDLDRFKEVNDTLGHAFGDALLGAATTRLLRNIRTRREGGDLPARLGGDEFAVVLAPEATLLRDAASEVASMARRLVETMSEPFEIAGHQMVVGASIGIALFPNDGDSAEDLLKHAELALYCAKQEGRGRHRFFEPGMDQKAQARRLLELELRQAVQFSPEQFELHYQPVIDVATRRPTGFEALIRWRHPERGLVPPADFIPLAEELGLILELGARALREACAEAARLPGRLRVAVNLSPVQFRNPYLVEAVAAALADSGLAPQRLELEITEGILLEQTEATMATLHRLKELGLRIAMDDFGTGYSSLGYLRSFPFDKIKLDRAFVRELETHGTDAAILHAVAGLCSRLGVTSTAEGVETEAQFRRLRAERCTEAQGYLFSRPVPAAEIPALLARLGAVAAETEAVR